MHYYRHDLALIHDRGQGQHADRCAPGILELLAPLVPGGLVLELGCGSGALTRHLLAAGWRVIATDASPDMLELARANLGPDADLRRLTRPDDPLPAIDICDLAFGQLQPGTESSGRTATDWAVISQYSRPAPDRFARDITTFVPDGHGAWRRDSEHHENVLVDTSGLPALLREHGVTATVGSSFGTEELPTGMVAVTATRS